MIPRSSDSGGCYTTPGLPTPVPAGELLCWSQSGSVFRGINKAHSDLPAGVYRPGIDGIGPHLEAIDIRSDQLLVLPDSASESLLGDLKRFWGRRDRYKELGYLHKRGVLLWGPPGSGKTSTVSQISSMAVQLNAVVLLVEHPEIAIVNLRILRGMDTERPILLILEDLDSLVRRYDESMFLSLLDGETQIDNVVSVATTNYPESLDKRFTDRPGRFALVCYIGMPSRESRSAYLKTKLDDIAGNKLDEWLDRTEGLPIDHIRELVILTQCDGATLDDALLSVAELRKKISSEKSPDSTSTGFSGR